MKDKRAYPDKQISYAIEKSSEDAQGFPASLAELETMQLVKEIAKLKKENEELRNQLKTILKYEGKGGAFLCPDCRED
jgi:hypothetical protein